MDQRQLLGKKWVDLIKVNLHTDLAHDGELWQKAVQGNREKDDKIYKTKAVKGLC